MSERGDMHSDHKNRIELTISGVRIKILTSEEDQYIYELANQIETRMDSFFENKPVQGVDIAQRLLMTCFTLVDDKEKVEKKQRHMIDTLERTTYVQNEKIKLITGENEKLKNRLHQAQKEFAIMMKENDKSKERVAESNTLITNIQRELLEKSAKAVREKKNEEEIKRQEELLWKRKYENLLQTIKEKDHAIRNFKKQDNDRKTIPRAVETPLGQVGEKIIPLKEVSNIRSNNKEMNLRILQERNRLLEAELKKAKLTIGLYEEEHTHEGN